MVTNLVPLATEEVEVEVAGAISQLPAIPIQNQKPLPIRSLSRSPSLTTEDLPVGGRLYHFRDNWTFCPWSHSVIKNGLGWSWVDNQKPTEVERFYQRSTPFLQDYVQELLLKKVIEPVQFLLFQARLFCVDKVNSSRKRVILDLSTLNKRIRCDKFRMLTIAQIRTLLPKKAYSCSVDLTDAYWHVPIARHLSPYLGFCLGRQAYVFKTMPFGLNIAPKVFTKLGKAVIQELRKLGILVAA